MSYDTYKLANASDYAPARHTIVDVFVNVTMTDVDGLTYTESFKTEMTYGAYDDYDFDNDEMLESIMGEMDEAWEMNDGQTFKINSIKM